MVFGGSGELIVGKFFILLSHRFPSTLARESRLLWEAFFVLFYFVLLCFVLFCLCLLAFACCQLLQVHVWDR